MAEDEENISHMEVVNRDGGPVRPNILGINEYSMDRTNAPQVLIAWPFNPKRSSSASMGKGLNSQKIS